MQISPKLKEKIAQAVETSMRIEGYHPASSPEIKRRAKELMERLRVQVSIPGK